MAETITRQLREPFVEAAGTRITDEGLKLLNIDVDSVKVTHPNIPGGIDILFDQGLYADPWHTSDEEQANALKMLLKAAHTGNIVLIENIINSRYPSKAVKTAANILTLGSDLTNYFKTAIDHKTSKQWKPINDNFVIHKQNMKQIKSNQKALIKQLRLNNPKYKGTDKELLQYYLYSPEALETLNF